MALFVALQLQSSCEAQLTLVNQWRNPDITCIDMGEAFKRKLASTSAAASMCVAFSEPTYSVLICH
jgi:hypothetical protein